jgi:hypothetical protein
MRINNVRLYLNGQIWHGTIEFKENSEWLLFQSSDNMLRVNLRKDLVNFDVSEVM